MKYVFTVLTAALLFMSIAGCTASGNDAVIKNAVPSLEEEIDVPIIFDTNNNFVAQYIRTGSLHGEEIPPISIIESQEQLEEYYLKNRRITFWDGQGNSFYNFDVAMGGLQISFKDAIAKYNDDFFADNLLVILFFVEGSGSIRHNVESVDFEEEKTSINLQRLLPGIGTADMADWHIIIEINHNDFVSKTINVEVTNKMLD